MDINYFDLSGGINLNSTKTELGTHKGQLPWADSKNVEIYLNKGIIKQKGKITWHADILSQETGK